VAKIIDVTPETTEIRIHRNTTLVMLVALTNEADGSLPDVAGGSDSVSFFLKGRDVDYAAEVEAVPEAVANPDGNVVRVTLPRDQWTITEPWDETIVLDWVIMRLSGGRQFSHQSGVLVLEPNPSELMA